MTNLINDIQNNALAALAQRAPGNVMSAIKQASAKTGVNFAYMVQQAGAESSFNPAAKAKTSSASGLYQFIERTWLSMVDKYGAKHGIQTDGKTRGELLELRNDPRAASLMAAEFASENEKFLKTHTDVEIGSTELYFAHFMGAGGAAAFLNARTENPLQQAAILFPKAAKANYNVFYEAGTGRAKTMDEVYAFFDKKFQIKDASAIQIAEAPPPPQKPNKNALYASSVVRRSPVFNYQEMISSPVEIMLMAQLNAPIHGKKPMEQAQDRTFSLFSNLSSYIN